VGLVCARQLKGIGELVFIFLHLPRRLFLITRGEAMGSQVLFLMLVF